MQIREVNSQGLKRELEVVVASGDLNERFQDRLNQIKDTVQLKGFRKGKVPVNHIKKIYGKSVMLEILNDAVKETSSKAIEERKERPALQPDIVLPEDPEKIDRILNGQDDLAYSISFEILPDIELTDFAKLQLERLVVDVGEKDRDEAIEKLIDNNLNYEAEEGRAAQDKDQLTIDFVGKVDGEIFEGGSAEGIDIVLGQGQFIPGFEEQLLGAKADDELVVEVTFPDDYGAEHLRGKPASFDTKVKAVSVAKRPEADDAFAQSLGLESADKLKELFTQRIADEYAQAARTKLKRELLDELEKVHGFDLPATLVDREFEELWKQVTDAMERSKETWEDKDETEEEAREEYRGIAERRVRLGLVIGEIGERNKIEVNEDELRKALMEKVRQFPGQEKFVYEYYQKNPGAVAELRAPIFEEKVVDFILELAKPTERKVTKEELQKALEEQDDDGGAAA